MLISLTLIVLFLMLLVNFIVYRIIYIVNFPERTLPNFVVGTRKVYLNRWYIIPRNKFFNIYLHEFRDDDDDRALHDHPWYSYSFLIKGSYIETVQQLPDLKMDRTYSAPYCIFRSAKFAHRISLLVDPKTKKKIPCWTVFITGPVVREWGFICPKRWVSWKEFCNPDNYGRRNNIGCDDI